MAMHKRWWHAFTLLAAFKGTIFYKEIWTPKSGEVNCERKLGNCKDPYAVTIKRGDSIVGHVLYDIHEIQLAGDCWK